MQRTFVAIKPDAVQRGLIGEIMQRFEKKGFKIIGLKIIQLDRKTAEKHYEEHIGKPFFEGLVKFITSGPIVAMVLEGINAVEVVRKFMGATNPANADHGTIRADFAHTMERNIVHGSDSYENAEREIAIFFDEKELIPGWTRDLEGRFIQLN
ncbi:MAG TPA: nucleoside-diphosphate kinase [Candidatus Gastranaerophilales bacterium]|nr:nucleoside-diphosphate kinase [Candidatus Gastranaerophilales bacterium]